MNKISQMLLLSLGLLVAGSAQAAEATLQKLLSFKPGDTEAQVEALFGAEAKRQAGDREAPFSMPDRGKVRNDYYRIDQVYIDGLAFSASFLASPDGKLGGVQLDRAYYAEKNQTVPSDNEAQAEYDRTQSAVEAIVGTPKQSTKRLLGGGFGLSHRSLWDTPIAEYAVVTIFSKNKSWWITVISNLKTPAN